MRMRATPQAPAIINKVLDKSAQARVFTWLDRDDVWVVNPEDIMPKAKKPAVDVKTDAEAVAKVQGWIDAKLKSLKENGQDNLLAAFQQRMAAPKVEEVEVYVARTLVASDGTVYELDADETELLGCVYIDPPGDDTPAGTDAITSWWVTDAHTGGALDSALAEFVPRWLADVWGFASIVIDP